MGAIAALASRFPDAVWDAVFTELCAVRELSVSTVPRAEAGDDHDEEDVKEDERTWRDPSAHKLRCAVRAWLDDDVCRRAAILVRVSGRKIDNY